MKVILKQDINGLGRVGETVDVKSGYGRNYLIPRNLAIVASKGNLRAIDEIKAQDKVRERKKRTEAERFKEKLERLSLTIEVLVGEEDKIFGSVTSQNVSDLIEQEGIKIPKKNIILEDPIKSLGVYTVPIKVDSGIVANVKLWVIRKA